MAWKVKNFNQLTVVSQQNIRDSELCDQLSLHYNITSVDFITDFFLSFTMTNDIK